jgi:hypothetical protein
VLSRNEDLSKERKNLSRVNAQKDGIPITSRRCLMKDLTAKLRKLVLGLSPDQAAAGRRGFDIPDPAMRLRLERVGATFVFGYNLALEARSVNDLGVTLDSVDLEWRGFAYEGAAMALALMDFFTLARANRLGPFLRGPGDTHRYMVHVGAGWAMARMPLRSGITIRQLDPMLKWLAIDGLGFHEGYFHWPRYSDGCLGKKRPTGYGAHVFDQGLGRSLWFVKGGEVRVISEHISRFSEGRREDLWSGIGLACAYAGAITREQLNELKAAAAGYGSSVAQGAAFAAKARQRAGNQAAHTENACQVLCGTSASAAAAITDAALSELKADSQTHRYEVWRTRIAAAFAEGGLLAQGTTFKEQEIIGI